MVYANYAVYGGSFDPPTYGHLNLINRAAKLFDHLTIGVGNNPDKTTLFTPAERVLLLKHCLAEHKNVDVDHYDGLLVDFCRSKGAHIILRGLRAVGDFESEFQMGLANMDLAPEIETVFLIADPDTLFVSSSVVKQIAKYRRDVRPYVPEIIALALYEKIRPYNVNG